jgi:DNA polymerase III subunit delta
VAALKPAYLIHGDDHGAVAERRAGLRALAERSQDGALSVEVLEGEEATPQGVAAALAAMTLALGQRVIIVDGAERWRQSEVEQQLVPALAQMPPETTLAVFAREEARAKAPAALHEAILAAGGQVAAQSTVKPWELPGWLREQAKRLGIALDAAGAKALAGQVGERQQRLLRELEKLALELDEPADGAQAVRVDAELIEARAAHSAEWRAYGLADALVAGDAQTASRTYLHLRGQGERLAGLTYLMASRLREALSISQRLAAGESAGEIKRSLRMPSRAADRLIADVTRSEPERLRQALVTLGRLELDSRGGAPITADRGLLAELEEDTLAQRAIEQICS